MAYRTDEHNNPTAFTTDVARQAGLTLGTDYEYGAPFEAGGQTYYTARLLGDPIELTLRVLDQIGFYTHTDTLRWRYVAIFPYVWANMPAWLKLATVFWMYREEGGTDMESMLEAAFVKARSENNPGAPYAPTVPTPSI